MTASFSLGLPGRQAPGPDLDAGTLGAGTGRAHAVAPAAGPGPPAAERPGAAGGVVAGRRGYQGRGGRGDGRRILAGTTPRRRRCETTVHPITTARDRTTADPHATT